MKFIANKRSWPILLEKDIGDITQSGFNQAENNGKFEDHVDGNKTEKQLAKGESNPPAIPPNDDNGVFPPLVIKCQTILEEGTTASHQVLVESLLPASIHKSPYRDAVTTKKDDILPVAPLTRSSRKKITIRPLANSSTEKTVKAKLELPLQKVETFFEIPIVNEDTSSSPLKDDVFAKKEDHEPEFQLIEKAQCRFDEGPSIKDSPGKIYIALPNPDNSFLKEKKKNPIKKEFKLGRTQKNPNERLAQLNKENKDNLVLHQYFETPFWFMTETILKKQFLDYNSPRRSGTGKTEWYSIESKPIEYFANCIEKTIQLVTERYGISKISEE